jgi:cytochrome bd-type quinol oxidase subunit 2
VIAVWPLASGHAQPERGLLLTLAPPTAIFGAIVYAATHAFDVSTTIDASLESAPWIAVTALIPLVMASGVLLAARVGRERAIAHRHVWPVGATWLFVLGSVGIGFIPGALELPDDVVGTQRSFLTLLGVAAVIGAIAGWLWNLRHPDHRRAPAPEPVVRAVGPPTRREALAYTDG